MDDEDGPFKAMFRTRGETQRVEIADGLARLRYHNLGLGTPFEMAIGGMRHQLKIRNQYAHSHWNANEKMLTFIDMQESAKQHTPVTATPVNMRHTTAEIVVAQEKHGEYVGDLLFWLSREAEVKRGRLEKNDYPKPGQLEAPPLYKPREKSAN